MNILLLSGSFREGSFNNILLEKTKSFLSDHTTTNYAIEQLPFYADKLDGENRPEVVNNFIAEVEAADAIIIATPEYNHSIPAVLKNAIDWASRPAFESPLKGKRVTILSASPSPAGGVHAQAHLKQILDSTLSVIFPAIAYTLADAYKKVDNGHLIDEQAIIRMERHINNFIEWI